MKGTAIPIKDCSYNAGNTPSFAECLGLLGLQGVKRCFLGVRGLGFRVEGLGFRV